MDWRDFRSIYFSEHYIRMNSQWIQSLNLREGRDHFYLSRLNHQLAFKCTTEKTMGLGRNPKIRRNITICMHQPTPQQSTTSVLDNLSRKNRLRLFTRICPAAVLEHGKKPLKKGRSKKSLRQCFGGISHTKSNETVDPL